MASTSFAKLATVTASTKRYPAVSGASRGAAVENVASLSCTPLDPVIADVLPSPGLEAPREVLQTYVDNGVDISEGDILVVSGTEYRVLSVGDWFWGPGEADYLQLTVEELKA